LILNHQIQKGRSQIAQKLNAHQILCTCCLYCPGVIPFNFLKNLYRCVVYDTQTRTKEIGIRKIMGADLPLVIWTLTRNYLKMILVSKFIAIPIAWLINMELLNIFYYKVKMNPFWFVIGVVFMLFDGGITALTQSLKTASKNPVETLRYDE